MGSRTFTHWLMFCKAEARRHPPIHRALELFPSCPGLFGRGHMERDGCDGAQLVGLSLARPLSQTSKTDRASLSDISAVRRCLIVDTKYAMTFCATDLVVFRKGDGEGVPAPVVSKLQADKERLTSSPVLIETTRTS